MSSPVDLNTQPGITRDINGPAGADDYIVKLKDFVSTRGHIAFHFPPLAENADSPIKHVFTDELFKGYAARFDGPTLARISASTDVEYIEPDGVCSIEMVKDKVVWNLCAISNPPVTRDPDSYRYPDSAGAGIDIYIVDTGVYTEHEEFKRIESTGSRARLGFAYEQFKKMEDGSGHGTHCAGIAAGNTYGVAKEAEIIAVKVLGDLGDGYASWVIAGLQWIAKDVAQKIAKDPKKANKSVVCMPLSRRKSKPLDDVVNQLIGAGIQVVAAAGNGSCDAGNTSPARLKDVLTIGSTNKSNRVMPRSNYGAAVDIWAPGEDIQSAWIDAPGSAGELPEEIVTTGRNTKKLSGTSMAAAHATGVAALLLGQKEMAANVLRSKLIGMARLNAVSKTTSLPLLYNGGEKGIDS